MTNNIKNEFEEYVKTLTEAICKEIFLERLEELCGEYEEGYKKIAGTANEIGLISKKIDEGSLKISDKLDGVITPEQLTEFRKYLEENTKESKELANFINETYKSEIEENIRHIIAKNQQLQRDLNNSIAEHVKGILDKLDNAADVVNDKLLENARNFSEYTGNFVAFILFSIAEIISPYSREGDFIIVNPPNESISGTSVLLWLSSAATQNMFFPVRNISSKTPSLSDIPESAAQP